MAAVGTREKSAAMIAAETLLVGAGCTQTRNDLTEILEGRGSPENLETARDVYQVERGKASAYFYVNQHGIDEVSTPPGKLNFADILALFPESLDLRRAVARAGCHFVAADGKEAAIQQILTARSFEAFQRTTGSTTAPAQEWFPLKNLRESIEGYLKRQGDFSSTDPYRHLKQILALAIWKRCVDITQYGSPEDLKRNCGLLFNDMMLYEQYVTRELNRESRFGATPGKVSGFLTEFNVFCRQVKLPDASAGAAIGGSADGGSGMRADGSGGAHTADAAPAAASLTAQVTVGAAMMAPPGAPASGAVAAADLTGS